MKFYTNIIIFLSIILLLSTNAFADENNQNINSYDADATIEAYPVDEMEPVIPSYWKPGVDISMQIGLPVNFVMIFISGELDAGFSGSIAISYHHIRYGVTLKEEFGYLAGISGYSTASGDGEYDDEYESDTETPYDYWFKGMISITSLTFDFYKATENSVFRFGLGGSILVDFDNFKDKDINGEYNHTPAFPMFRLEFAWLYNIDEHFRVGFELDISTLVVLSYIRPSLNMTYTF